MARGAHSNVSTLSLGSHTGTHIDAPVHFLKGAPGIDRMPFEATNGPARVISITDRALIEVEELRRHRPRRGERLLLKTVNSPRVWRSEAFVERFVHLTTSAGGYLAERGVRTIGVDYLSVGGYHANGSELHRVLLKAGIWIIEGLDLSRARPGPCDLACLPLKIVGGDGAPARAFVRTSPS